MPGSDQTPNGLELMLANWARSFARYGHLRTPEQRRESVEKLMQQVDQYHESEKVLRGYAEKGAAMGGNPPPAQPSSPPPSAPPTSQT